MSQNFFLQRVVEKGGQFSYDKEELKQEVLSKLKKISIEKNKFSQTAQSYGNAQSNPLRVKSAFVRSPKNKKTSGRIEQSYVGSGAKSHVLEKQVQKEGRIIEEDEFLSFEKSEDLLAKYKQNIRQVDGSISDLNVKKTVKLLKNLQAIADGLN